MNKGKYIPSIAILGLITIPEKEFPAFVVFIIDPLYPTAKPVFESVNLMKYISPFTLILTVNLEPIYGIILAFFIFGESEKMSSIFYGASLVMILAIVVNGIIKTRKKSKEVAEENML